MVELAGVVGDGVGDARRRAAGIETVFVQSSDGGTPWAQFSPELVQALHSKGLRA